MPYIKRDEHTYIYFFCILHSFSLFKDISPLANSKSTTTFCHYLAKLLSYLGHTAFIFEPHCHFTTLLASINIKTFPCMPCPSCHFFISCSQILSLFDSVHIAWCTYPRLQTLRFPDLNLWGDRYQWEKAKAFQSLFIAISSFGFLLIRQITNMVNENQNKASQTCFRTKKKIGLC